MLNIRYFSNSIKKWYKKIEYVRKAIDMFWKLFRYPWIWEFTIIKGHNLYLYVFKFRMGVRNLFLACEAVREPTLEHCWGLNGNVLQIACVCRYHDFICCLFFMHMDNNFIFGHKIYIFGWSLMFNRNHYATL